MKQDRYYVTGYYGEGAQYMIYDLVDNADCTLINSMFRRRPALSKSAVGKLYIAYCERKERTFYRKFIQWADKSRLLRNIFFQTYNLSKLKFDHNYNNYILFVNSGLCVGYTKTYLEWLKRRYPHIKLVLYIVDPTDILLRVCSKDVWKVFDLIYNTNICDCERYRHKYWPLIMSDVMENSPKACEDKKLYFCGAGSDRIALLKEIAHYSKDRGIPTNFLVYHYDNPEPHEGITFIRKPISYQENLQNVNECSCILEIMHAGYTNQTQRYPEAVISNKKLLTNNENIKEYPYYDAKFMRIFHSVDDIDWEWLMDDGTDVDYNYKGDFSPVALLNDISKTFRCESVENEEVDKI